jgi:hypothetical protein
MTTSYRSLREDKIHQTVERLRQRIADLFPDSGLSSVAAELVQLSREAAARAETIRRPNFLLRAGLVLLGLAVLAGVGHYLWTSANLRTAMDDLLPFLDASKAPAAYLAATAVFLVTLEVRFKRRKALRAVHELRAVAHVIDMHQLNKDPERAGTAEGARMESGRPMTLEEIGRYLHYCTELLAIVSKIGQLYVQDFPDATAQAAVDQFENLATGLSGKIWHKIMTLDRFRPEGDRAPGEPVSKHVKPIAAGTS